MLGVVYNLEAIDERKGLISGLGGIKWLRFWLILDLLILLNGVIVMWGIVYETGWVSNVFLWRFAFMCKWTFSIRDLDWNRVLEEIGLIIMYVQLRLLVSLNIFYVLIVNIKKTLQYRFQSINKVF